MCRPAQGLITPGARGPDCHFGQLPPRCCLCSAAVPAPRAGAAANTRPAPTAGQAALPPCPPLDRPLHHLTPFSALTTLRPPRSRLSHAHDPHEPPLHDLAAQRSSGLPPLSRINTTRCAHSLSAVSPDLLLRCGESGTAPPAQLVSDAPLLLLLPSARCDNCLLGECACVRGLPGLTTSLTMPLQRQSSRCVSLTMDWTTDRGEEGGAALHVHHSAGCCPAGCGPARHRGALAVSGADAHAERARGAGHDAGHGDPETPRARTDMFMLGLGRDADTVSMCQQATAQWRGAA